jgi:hypothetical protein
VPRVDRPRIAAEEAPDRRIVLPRAEVVLRGRGVEALAGVEVRGERIGDVLQQVAKRGVVIRLDDRAARVGQGAGAALGIG